MNYQENSDQDELCLKLSEDVFNDTMTKIKESFDQLSNAGCSPRTGLSLTRYVGMGVLCSIMEFFEDEATKKAVAKKLVEDFSDQLSEYMRIKYDKEQDEVHTLQ